MSAIQPSLKDKIIRIIRAIAPDAKIYLFGSYATQTAREDSDIDLAIDVGKRAEQLCVAEIKSLLDASFIPKKFDVVDIYNVDAKLKTSILKHGILWKK